MVKTLDGHILMDWTTARTKSGVSYYLNHKCAVTQWDHPEYVAILEEVQAVNSVKYAAYRTACKLRRLQTRLKLHEASLQCIATAFDNAGLRAAENHDYVSIQQVEPVILYILRTTHRHKPVHTALCAELAVNLLLNVFDPRRSGSVQVLGCKVLLVVLCGGRLQEKYRYLFTQLANHNNCCTRRRLGQLLRDLAKIPELLSEAPSFGVPLVSAAVDSCFKEVDSDVGITEECFLSWLLQEPQTLVWWTTLYRLSAAELVCHDVKCGVCKQRPMIGLRYQCLQCLGYNLCQDCFLHARTSRGHKLTHPIQEYCHERTSKEWRRAIMKIFRHRLSGSGTNKQRYLSISSNPSSTYHLSSILDDGRSRTDHWISSRQSDCDGSLNDEDEEEDDDEDTGEAELMSRTILHPDDTISSDDQSASKHSVEVRLRRDHRNGSNKKNSEPTIIPSTPRHQIHSVIMHLQEGHQQLWEGLEKDTTDSRPISENVVEQHTLQLQTQINKLKDILQNYSQMKNGSSKSMHPVTSGLLPCLESTPIVGERGLCLNLSPISAITTDKFDDSAVLDNKENHMTENPSSSSTSCSGGIQDKAPTPHRPIRSPFTPHQRLALAPLSTTQNSPQMFSDNPTDKQTMEGSGLPSFTEVNFSDLTSASGDSHQTVSSSLPLSTLSSNMSDDTSEKSPKLFRETGKMEDNGEALHGNLDQQEVVEVKEELELILRQLDNIFPAAAAQGIVDVGNEGREIVEAACELGDVLANYVSAVPQHSDL